MERRRRRKMPNWANRSKVRNPSTLSSSEEEDEEQEKEVTHGEEGTRDWSTLLDPLLLSILSRLTSLEDFFAFRGVCRNWRSLSSPAPQSLSSQPPLLLLTQIHTRPLKAFYDFTRKRLYRAVPPWDCCTRDTIGYSHGYVITSTFKPSQRILFWNIFTEERIRLPKSPIEFDRAILSSSPASPDCLVVLLERPDLFTSSVLQYCRVGDRRWKVHDFSPPGIKDAIFFKGKLYALTMTGRLGVVQLVPSPELTLLEAENAESIDMRAPGSRWCFLAELGQELMVVCFHVGYDFSVDFGILKWDCGGGGWLDVCDLGGMTLFMRYNGFAASVQPCKLGLRENCIYYVMGSSAHWVVYSLEDQMIKVEDAGPLISRTIQEPPVWVFPSLC